MKWIVAFTLLFSGCFQSNDFGVVQGLSLKKQKQKVQAIEKKLERAQEIALLAEADIERLKIELDQAKLTYIRKQIDEFDEQEKNTASLFVEEREDLYEMIESGPSPQALEAQVELDRILRIITEQSAHVL